MLAQAAEPTAWAEWSTGTAWVWQQQLYVHHCTAWQTQGSAMAQASHTHLLWGHQQAAPGSLAKWTVELHRQKFQMRVNWASSQRLRSRSKCTRTCSTLHPRCQHQLWPPITFFLRAAVAFPSSFAVLSKHCASVLQQVPAYSLTMWPSEHHSMPTLHAQLCPLTLIEGRNLFIDTSLIPINGCPHQESSFF